jgi:hypothetical protein
MSKFMKLSRAEMRDVLGGLRDPGSGGGPVGGVNPNCEGTSGTDDYYCCGAHSTTSLGNTDCLTASARCNGSMITNDPERCNN